MFVLRNRITVGSACFDRIVETTVMRSIHHPAAHAAIRVPANAVLKSMDGLQAGRDASTETVRQGDTVKIELAYGTEWHTEFNGYVRELKTTTITEIVCEDEYYRTRDKEVSCSGQATKLADLLADCGLTVGQAADLELKNFVVDRRPLAHLLKRLQAEYGLNVFFDTDGKVYALDKCDYRLPEVRYELRKNVIRQDAWGLTTFLQPFAEPCMVADVNDSVYPEHNGRFYISAVQTAFGANGARRLVSLESLE